MSLGDWMPKEEANAQEEPATKYPKYHVGLFRAKDDQPNALGGSIAPSTGGFDSLEEAQAALKTLKGWISGRSRTTLDYGAIYEVDPTTGDRKTIIESTKVQVDPEAVRRYQERKEAKVERLSNLAAKTAAAAEATHERAEKMADVIPFGQPILVGHYSEKGDRNYRDRIDKTFHKSFELTDKAKEYESRAENAASDDVIKTEDPEAIPKLEAKIAALEKKREQVKGMTDEQIWKIRWGGGENLLNYNPETGKRDKMPNFRAMELESVSRIIRNTKQRIADVQATKKIEAVDETINGVRLHVDQADNRVRLSFPGIPPPEVRQKLKSLGFRWSPYNKAWQAYINQYAIERARELLKVEKGSESPAQTPEERRLNE